MKPPGNGHACYLCLGSFFGPCENQLSFCKNCHPEVLIPQELVDHFPHFDFRCEDCFFKNENPLLFINKNNTCNLGNDLAVFFIDYKGNTTYRCIPSDIEKPGRINSDYIYNKFGNKYLRKIYYT
jgi:hypothetical protein